MGLIFSILLLGLVLGSLANTFIYRIPLSFYPDKKTLSQDEILAIEQVYNIWEESIKTFGGDYLVGDYSLADIAFVPSVLRFSSHFKADDRWPATSAWIERLLARPYIKAWLADANKEPPIYLPGYRGDD